MMSDDLYMDEFKICFEKERKMVIKVAIALTLINDWPKLTLRRQKERKKKREKIHAKP